MSRGTRITPLRLPPDLIAQIDTAIAGANAWRADEEYNRTSWIVQAIREKLAKLKRGRKPHRRSPGGANRVLAQQEGTSADQAGPGGGAAAGG